MAIEMSPHALIAWKEDHKREKVPLSFVRRFSKSWSKQGWDKAYEYHVFWSPNEDDSPQSMLKRVAEIPTFEAGTGREQAGYHRAVVLMVKKSLAELDKATDNKRTPVSLKTFTSFDNPKRAEEAKEPRNKPQVKTVAKQKPVILKKGAKKKKSKSKGINLSATIHNAGPNLSESLAKRFNLSASDEDTEEEEKSHAKDLCDNGSSSNSKKEPVIDRSGPSSDSLSAPIALPSPSITIKTEPADSLNVTPSPSTVSAERPTPASHDIAHKTVDIGRTGLLLSALSGESGEGDSNHDINHETKNVVIPKPAASSSSSDSEDSSSSSAEPVTRRKRKHSSSSDEVNRLDSGEAIDPDFTPRKYIRLQEELNIERQQVKRILNLNMSLQCKLLESENQSESSKQEVEKMQAKVAKLEKEIKRLKTKTSDAGPFLKSPTTSSPVACIITPEKEAAFKSSASSPALSPIVKTDPKPVTTTSASNENLHEVCDGDVALLCDAVLSGEESNQSDNDKKVDIIVKPLINLGIAFSDERLLAIRSIPRGEKADSRFVKDLLVITFGPEVLASCSKDGSKRGGKRTKEDGKETNPKEKKPALDKTKLAAVREVFLQRVRAEGVEFMDAEALERTNSSTFYKAFSGAQRRCRNLGYGKGLKTNEPNSELFSFM